MKLPIGWVINHKTEYNFCDRFSGNKQKMYVCSKIGSLKGFLSRSNGLDLKTVIEKQISDLETEIPKDLQKKFIDSGEVCNVDLYVESQL